MKNLLVCVVLSVSAFAQSSAPLSKTEACDRFMPAIVSVLGAGPDPKDHGSGTGFLISADGWVITAEHVLVNQRTRSHFPTFEVVMADGDTWLQAREVSASSSDSDVEDFALLRVDAAKLPKNIRIAHQRRDVIPLHFGDESKLRVGSDLILIGGPTGAGFPADLCLTATVAGIGHPGVFYQGIAVEGMSGGPVVSLDTGGVVGIIRRRAAVLLGLDQVQNGLNAAEKGIDDKERDANSREAISGLVFILSHQFNNGLGYATGVQKAHAALEDATKSSP